MVWWKDGLKSARMQAFIKTCNCISGFAAIWRCRGLLNLTQQSAEFISPFYCYDKLKKSFLASNVETWKKVYLFVHATNKLNPDVLNSCTILNHYCIPKNKPVFQAWAETNRPRDKSKKSKLSTQISWNFAWWHPM